MVDWRNLRGRTWLFSCFAFGVSNLIVTTRLLYSERTTVFPQIRPAGIIVLHCLQMRVLLENTTFLLHKIVRIAGIIRVAGIIRGRALYEEIRYISNVLLTELFIVQSIPFD